MFLWGKPRPYSKGAGLQRPPKILGPCTCAHTVCETTFCMVIKLDVRQIFTRSTTNAMTRDLFAVADVLVWISNA